MRHATLLRAFATRPGSAARRLLGPSAWAALTILGTAVQLAPAGASGQAICPDDVPTQVEIPAHTGANPRFSTSSARAVVTASDAFTHCDVQGTITTDSAPDATPIRFQVRLPHADPPSPVWEPFTGRMVFGGKGGLAGTLRGLDAGVFQRISEGFAVVDTDTGHQGTSSRDGRWASGAPEERKNFHFQANHLVAVAAKSIIDDYYTPSQPGDLPSYSYFQGCSNPGREGLVAAQEFPADFDGIVAGAPAIGRSEQLIAFNIPYNQAQWGEGFLSPVPSPFGRFFGDPSQAANTFPAPSRIFRGQPPANLVGVLPGKLEILSDTVRALCDGRDGIVDGLLDDPRRCPPEEILDALPRCDDASVCFNDRELEIVRIVYGRTAAVPGSEDTPLRSWDQYLARDTDPPSGPFVPLGLWDPASGQRSPTVGSIELCPAIYPASVCAGPDGLPNFLFQGYSIADSLLRYFVFDDDPAAPFSFAEKQRFLREFDLGNEDDVALVRSRIGDGDGLNPDLRAFRDRGGKLVLYTGWADVGIGPMMTVDYYEDVARTTGAPPGDFARLFMVPGMHHCFVGPPFDPGPMPDREDIFQSIIDWTESGTPPDSFAATTRVPPPPFTRARMSRPICPYPQVARQIDPDGSTTDAANFHCVDDPFPVDVDVKPRGPRKCITNNGRGVIPVGILSGGYLDAAQIDPRTVTLDGQPVRVRRDGRPRARLKDLNGDGQEDLLVQIRDVAGTYDGTTDRASVSARTFAGMLVEGTDEICIVPKGCKSGKYWLTIEELGVENSIWEATPKQARQLQALFPDAIVQCQFGFGTGPAE